MTYINSTLQSSGKGTSYVAKLWRYRSLCANLVGSDLRARFRRSRLGIIWAIIQPLAFSIMIAIVWGALFQQDSMTYAVYVFSGMIVWEFVSNTVMASQDALINSDGYLKQGRIPFLIFQLRAPLAGFVTFLAGLIGLLGLQAVLGGLPAFGPHYALVIPFSAILILFLIPIAIIFSILGTQFRDLRHAMMVLLNALFFMSPIMIAREYLEAERLQFLHYANPMMPLLDLLRLPLLDGQMWQMQPLVVILAWTGGLWVLALSISQAVGRKIIFAL